MKIISQGDYRFWQFDILSQYSNLYHGCFHKHPDLDITSAQKALNLANFSFATQIHSDIILGVFKEGHAGEGDALITNKKIPLCIQHADCQAGLLFDPCNQVIAAVHCGWRGSVHKIFTKVIDRLKISYGCNPKNILACISPSLGPNASQFLHYQKEFPESFHKYQVKPFYFDFWRISYEELLAAGIDEKNIEIAKICTFSNPSECFSYRYDKTKKRLLSFLALL